jgi:hypothetical protein
MEGGWCWCVAVVAVVQIQNYARNEWLNEAVCGLIDEFRVLCRLKSKLAQPFYFIMHLH